MTQNQSNEGELTAIQLEPNLMHEWGNTIPAVINSAPFFRLHSMEMAFENGTAVRRGTCSP
jgi:hypothetical protein